MSNQKILDRMEIDERLSEGMHKNIVIIKKENRVFFRNKSIRHFLVNNFPVSHLDSLEESQATPVGENLVEHTYSRAIKTKSLKIHFVSTTDLSILE